MGPEMLDDIKATTVGEVNALAAEFLKADRQVTVIINRPGQRLRSRPLRFPKSIPNRAIPLPQRWRNPIPSPL